MNDNEPEPSDEDGKIYRVGFLREVYVLENGHPTLGMEKFIGEREYSKTDALKVCEARRSAGHRNVILFSCNGDNKSYSGRKLTEMIKKSESGLGLKGDDF